MVVYESIFGCTADIARAVREGLLTADDHRGHDQVDLVEVNTAPTDLADVDLLLIGAPTHTFSLSRPSTREDAELRSDGQHVSDGIGIREWLESLETDRGGWAAGFTTIMSKPTLIKYMPNAGHLMERQLRRRGRTLIADTEDFFVEGMDGPLAEGEVERARQWAARIHQRLALLEHERPAGGE